MGESSHVSKEVGAHSNGGALLRKLPRLLPLPLRHLLRFASPLEPFLLAAAAAVTVVVVVVIIIVAVASIARARRRATRGRNGECSPRGVSTLTLVVAALVIVPFLSLVVQVADVPQSYGLIVRTRGQSVAVRVLCTRGPRTLAMRRGLRRTGEEERRGGQEERRGQEER